MARPVTVISVLLAAAFTGAAFTASPAAHVSRTVDNGLCPFPLQVTVTSKDPIDQPGTSVLKFALVGPSTITLRNGSTGRTATLRSTGPYATSPKTGTVSFSGHQVWFWASGNHVPFLSTDGTGSFVAPAFVLTGKTQARVIDPCALVAGSVPSTRPAGSPAPWGLPQYALSRIERAGLKPLLGTLLRHDHVHLDVIVDGKKVTVPAGVGLAEPHDTGPCPSGQTPLGDCVTGHIYVAQVANSPLHTHSTSGLIHVEPDRPGTYTLGQFFDEWGVRLSSSCVGGYCAGGGKELRVYVNGRRVARSPRSVVLTNHQEVAVVFGGAGDFSSVPATFTGGWPGLGCGGPGEHSCLP